MVDETTDTSEKTVFRSRKIIRLTVAVEIQDGMCRFCVKLLKKVNIQNKLIAQTYNGGSIMPGVQSGLQA